MFKRLLLIGTMLMALFALTGCMSEINNFIDGVPAEKDVVKNTEVMMNADNIQAALNSFKEINGIDDKTRIVGDLFFNPEENTLTITVAPPDITNYNKVAKDKRIGIKYSYDFASKKWSPKTEEIKLISFSSDLEKIIFTLPQYNPADTVKAYQIFTDKVKSDPAVKDIYRNYTRIKADYNSNTQKFDNVFSATPYTEADKPMYSISAIVKSDGSIKDYKAEVIERKK